MNTIMEFELSSQFTKQLQLERSLNKNHNNNNKKTPSLNRNRTDCVAHCSTKWAINDLGTDHLNHNVVFRKRKLLAKETLTGDLSLLHLASRNHKERINAIHYGEQTWRSGDGTRLPPMCPCLDFRNVCGLSLLVVVIPRRFLPVVFPSDQKPTFHLISFISYGWFYLFIFLIHNLVKRVLSIATDF